MSRSSDKYSGARLKVTVNWLPDNGKWNHRRAGLEFTNETSEIAFAHLGATLAEAMEKAIEIAMDPDLHVILIDANGIEQALDDGHRLLNEAAIAELRADLATIRAAVVP